MLSVIPFQLMRCSAAKVGGRDGSVVVSLSGRGETVCRVSGTGPAAAETASLAEYSLLVCSG